MEREKFPFKGDNKYNSVHEKVVMDYASCMTQKQVVSAVSGEGRRGANQLTRK